MSPSSEVQRPLPVVRCRSTPPVTVACCSGSAPGLVAPRRPKLLCGFSGFQWISVGFSGLQWVSVGLWVSVGCGGLWWVVVGCGGLWWVVVGFRSLILVDVDMGLFITLCSSYRFSVRVRLAHRDYKTWIQEERVQIPDSQRARKFLVVVSSRLRLRLISTSFD